MGGRKVRVGQWRVGGGTNQPHPQDHIIINEMELHLHYRIYATAAVGNGGGGGMNTTNNTEGAMLVDGGGLPHPHNIIKAVETQRAGMG